MRGGPAAQGGGVYYLLYASKVFLELFNRDVAHDGHVLNAENSSDNLPLACNNELRLLGAKKKMELNNTRQPQAITP
jgi:hypothetical protein